MTIFKYDSTFIGYMNFFKTLTGVDARDCFPLDGILLFVTEKGKAGLAIGKAGKNILNLKSKLKKNVKIIETSDSAEGLVANFVFPLRPISVSKEENKVNIKFASSRERRVLLSNNLENLKQLKFVVKRYFPDIEDIIVLQ